MCTKCDLNHVEGAGEWLHIGDVKVLTSKPAAPELVPRLYGKSPSPTVLLIKCASFLLHFSKFPTVSSLITTLEVDASEGKWSPTYHSQSYMQSYENWDA